jgi:hypothetical protein
MPGSSLMALDLSETGVGKFTGKLVGFLARESVGRMASGTWFGQPFRKKDPATGHEDSLGFS